MAPARTTSESGEPAAEVNNLIFDYLQNTVGNKVTLRDHN